MKGRLRSDGKRMSAEDLVRLGSDAIRKGVTTEIPTGVPFSDYAVLIQPIEGGYRFMVRPRAMAVDFLDSIEAGAGASLRSPLGDAMHVAVVYDREGAESGRIEFAGVALSNSVTVVRAEQIEGCIRVRYRDGSELEVSPSRCLPVDPSGALVALAGARPRGVA